MPYFNGAALPDFNNPRANTDEKIKMLGDAVVELNDKLVQAINNIDDDNISPDFIGSIGTQIEGLAARITALENN